MRHPNSRHGILTVPGLLLFTAIATGCSGSSSGGGVPADLNGYFKVWYTAPGGSVETGPDAAYFTTTNGVVDGAAMTGTVNGATFSVTQVLPIFSLYFNGTMMTADTAQGALTLSNSNLTGSFRMERFAPAGTLTASGLLGGNAINVNTTTAVGSRDYSDQAMTTLTELKVVHADLTQRFELSFQPAGLAVGTLNAGSGVQVKASFFDDAGNSSELDATSGTVTVTKYDATGFTASYSLTLTGGETVSGSFDVAWDIDAFDP